MPIVTKEEFLAELNRRLRLHPAYQPGMRFLPHPPNGTVEAATGYTWEPETLGNPYPFNEVANGFIADGYVVQ